jgi:hypothetical protein
MQSSGGLVRASGNANRVQRPQAFAGWGQQREPLPSESGYQRAMMLLVTSPAR